jgi:hypothetical protein
MARAGGIGIIHRFMTAERQAEEVRRCRAESPSLSRLTGRAARIKGAMYWSGTGSVAWWWWMSTGGLPVSSPNATSSSLTTATMSVT